jgi:elongation factor G
VLAHKLVPFLCGSSLRNKGIQQLLDAIVDFLPSPLDMPALVGVSPLSGEQITCVPDVTEPTSALAFKIATDPYMGRMTYFRVYSGAVRRGETLVNATSGKKERVGRLVRIHADRREDTPELRAGDIGAILGFRNAATGDTLCGEDRIVRLEAISFPAPVVYIAVEPKSRADQERMGNAIARLADEDPTIIVRQDERTGQTVIAGMGELHLDVFVDRMRREFGVEARVGQPEVAYCETITRSARAEARLVKQTGGHGQYAHVVLEIEPLPQGGGFVFEDRLHGTSIPRNFVPAIEAGVKDGMQRGVLANNPLVDMKVVLVDGSYHEVDSSDMAFRTAASLALRDGAMRAGPVILEPVMRVEVVAPDEYTGDVMSELNMRRAAVTGLEVRNGMQTMRAHAPLATMFGYATSLRSRTQGRGTFTMEFDHYARVSPDVARRLTEKVA